MSISRQNLTAIIVSFMSEKVIHDCINSIPKDIKIVIVDNSNNKFFKTDIEKNITMFVVYYLKVILEWEQEIITV